MDTSTVSLNTGAANIPDEFTEVERERISQHRKAVGASSIERLDEVPGLALSGGGIRSAVFSLGVMQALSEREVLNEFSYLSTVSGGTYMGAFYGSLFVPDSMKRGQHAGAGEFETTAAVAARRIKPKTPPEPINAITPIEYLRNNCNYLVPNGLNDALDSIMFSGRNWFAVQYVLGVSIVSLLLAIHIFVTWLQRMDYWENSSPYCDSLFLLLVAATLITLGFSPLSRAYWLTQNLAQDRRLVRRLLPFFSLAAVMTISIGTLAFLGLSKQLFLSGHIVPLGWISIAVLVSAVAGIVYFELARRATKDDPGITLSDPNEDASDSRPFVDRLRNRLSNGYTQPVRLRSGKPLLSLSQLMLLVLGLAIVSAAGTAIDVYLRCKKIDSPTAVLAALGATGSVVARFLFSKASDVATQARRLPPYFLASIAAVVAAAITLAFWSLVARRIGDVIKETAFDWLGRTQGFWEIAVLFALAFLLALIAFIDGFCLQFLNLSTYQRLYSMRLTRAFLGASNQERLEYEVNRDVTALQRGDSLSMTQYFDARSCAPVHLINVTINKTVDWSSALVNRTARGMGMSIGPAGITVGAKFGVLKCAWSMADDMSVPATYVRTAGLAKGELPMNVGDIWLESMTLGDWIAISGAAVSTGLGAKTSIGYSMLLGLANVRLGYWWDTYVTSNQNGRTEATQKRVPASDLASASQKFGAKWFGTQRLLLNELTGHFEGPRPRWWYLTDGGHFDNTGVYELLRRRLKFILLLDNGADDKLQFEDLAALQSLVRVDLGIELCEVNHILQPVGTRFKLDYSRIAKSVTEFKQQGSKCALQLKTIFDDKSEGMLLVLKPRLVPESPYDVRQYQCKQPSFPQETTANQFFDDVQWEAHRALAEFEALQVFLPLRKPASEN